MYYLKVYNNVLVICGSWWLLSKLHHTVLLFLSLYTICYGKKGLCFVNDILNFVYSLSYSFNIVQIPAS